MGKILHKNKLTKALNFFKVDLLKIIEKKGKREQK